MQFSRRNLLRYSSLAATSMAAGRGLGQQPVAKRKNPICVFTKPFNSLSFDELAERIAEIGFDGIEAPIRRGGHVEPAAVENELPKLVESLAKCGLAITVMTSDINDPNDQQTEKVLRTASSLGITRYRMKYFKYSKKESIESQLAAWHDQLVDLAAMNHDFGVTGLYQNHAGNGYMGAAIWDIDRVLDGISPAEIAMAYDIRHATAEGGASWPTTLRLARPHVDTVYVKDFLWEGAKMKNVPLGEGRVSANFFKTLNAWSFDGPISLHEEYLDHRDPELVDQHLRAMKKDLETLQAMLSGGV
ncbi:MAG: sugar phosphate isomerase/epimerase family protein [Planctomycetota bacterium]